MDQHPRSRAGLICLVLSAVCFASSCASERVIQVGQRIHHDDFEYRVTGFTVPDSIGSGATQRKTARHFYVVTFEVENRAKRVGHRWDNSIAYVVDDLGHTYENLPDLQAILNAQQPFNYSLQHVTPAGSVEDTRLVFELPRDVAHPCLMVRGELLMGDLFDGKAFTRTKIRLF